ncbi:MAG: hypothetical protein NVS1B4_02890 [Gemmatimonadaceae bacterium]
MDSTGPDGRETMGDSNRTAPLGAGRGENLSGASAEIPEVTPEVAARNAAAIAAVTDLEASVGDPGRDVADISPELLDYAAHDRGRATHTNDRSASDGRRTDAEREVKAHGDDDSGELTH